MHYRTPLYWGITGVEHVAACRKWHLTTPYRDRQGQLFPDVELITGRGADGRELLPASATRNPRSWQVGSKKISDQTADTQHTSDPPRPLTSGHTCSVLTIIAAKWAVKFIRFVCCFYLDDLDMTIECVCELMLRALPPPWDRQTH